MLSSLKRRPKLRNNIAALGVVQVSNYVIPLVTLPYLTRVLGAEAYGKVVFAQVFMACFVLLVDYGFSWSATRQVSGHRADKDAVSRIFSATWAAQWLLVFFSALILTASVLLNGRLRSDALLYVSAFTFVVGTALFPVWFLQGLELLQVVAGMNLISRLLALAPIFLFVKQPEDAAFVLLIQGAGSVAAGVFALLWIQKKSLVTWCVPGWLGILTALREGGSMFSARFSISLYTEFVPLVLGWQAGPIELAYFNIADKLRRGAQSVLKPLSQALFPRMSHLVVADFRAAFVLIKKSALAVIIVAGSASATLWFLADWLAIVLGGDSFHEAGEVIRLISPLPLIIGISSLLGLQIMVPLGLNRAFNRILFSAAVLSIVVTFPMVIFYQAKGAVLTVLIVEGGVTAAMTVFLWRSGYFTINKWAKELEK